MKTLICLIVLCGFLLPSMRKVHVASASSLVGIAPIQIFFNDPARKINPITLENKLIVFMRSARESFDGAFYDISSEVVANELIALKKRGVVVRLVMESDTKSRSAIRKIISEGIQIVFDDSDGLMHNKFAIVDGVAVWTGSYNPVSHGEENDNNAVLVYSPDLASRFSEEFTDMFEHRLFGIARRGRPFDRLVALNAIDIAGTSVRAFFSPRHGIESIVAELVRNASSSVHFMAFSFTSDIIGEALLENRRRGVDVHGIVEERGALSTFSEYVKMIVEGMDVKIRRGRGVMHHKVIVIDGRIVITGSFNFSRGADSINDENIVIIESEEVARAYLNEFNRVRERSG